MSEKVLAGTEIDFAPIPLYIVWLEIAFANEGGVFVKVATKVPVAVWGTAFLSDTTIVIVLAFRYVDDRTKDGLRVRTGVVGVLTIHDGRLASPVTVAVYFKKALCHWVAVSKLTSAAEDETA